LGLRHFPAGLATFRPPTQKKPTPVVRDGVMGGGRGFCQDARRPGGVPMSWETEEAVGQVLAGNVAQSGDQVKLEAG
jgi:hypothetical protein